MKTKRLKLIAAIFFGMNLTVLNAQESINSAGGSAINSGGSISYSVGQVLYQTKSSTNISLAEGIQQPYEISEITSIQKIMETSPSVYAFPNPTTDGLTLEVEYEEFSKLKFQLINLQGNILEDKQIKGTQTIINLGNLVPATYYLKIIRNKEEIKTFKIIKNQ